MAAPIGGLSNAKWRDDLAVQETTQRRLKSFKLLVGWVRMGKSAPDFLN